MKKTTKHTLKKEVRGLAGLSLLLLSLQGTTNAQCLTAAGGQWPLSTVNIVCTGSPQNIVTDGYASEYSLVSLAAGVTYTFTSSVATDFITISNSGGTAALTFGTTPVVYTPSTTGPFRFYTHTNAACGSQAIERTRAVSCAVPPVPANNEASGAVSLTVNPDFNCGSFANGSTVSATQSPDATPGCNPTGINDDVWYSFVATNTSHRITFSNVSAGTMAAALYTGTPGSLTAVPSACASTTLNASGLAIGTTYYIRAYTTSATASVVANFTICVGTTPLPPANDNSANAIALTVNPDYNCGSVTNGTTISSTQSPETAPGCSATGINDDVWFTFVASNTAHRIIFSNVGTGTMVAALYTGTPGSLSPVANACASSTLNATGLTPGTTYYVRAYTSSATATTVTNFTICVGTQPPPPVNDVPATATLLAVGAGCSNAPYDNTYATFTTGEPISNCSATTGTHTLWFKFAAPASGAVRVSTDLGAGTLTDTRLGLFSATDSSVFSTFSIIACDEDGGSVIIDPSDLGTYMSVLYATGLTPGQVYYAEVDGFISSNIGTFCIAVDELSNNMLASAATCTSGVQIPEPTTTPPAYTGWVPLLDANSRLIALVRNQAGTSVGGYTPAQNINTGAVRQDVNGLKYLDRNFRITNTVAGPYDVQLFMLTSEQAALQAADPAATLSGLNITRVTGETSCTNNGTGTTSLITQTGSGSVNGVSWVQFTTPGFSNFFVNAGTTPLPVTLEHFSGQNKGAVNQLNWKTTMEKNFSHFELQRSANGSQFSKIATINANRNTSGSSYAYTDTRPLEGLNIYRLTMVDMDGKTRLSDMVQLSVAAGNTLYVSVNPNPVQQQLTVSLSGKTDGKGQVQVLDLMGKVLQTITVMGNNTTIDMSSYAAGPYMIRYTDNSHNEVIKVSKN